MVVGKTLKQNIIEFCEESENLSLFEQEYKKVMAFKIALMPSHEDHFHFFSEFKPFLINHGFFEEGMGLTEELPHKEYRLNFKKTIQKKNRVEPVLRTLKGAKEKYNPELFIPMKTGTPMDRIFSNNGGIYRGRIFMAIGDPGVGKSTLLMKMLTDLKEQDPNLKCLYILSEMTEIDLIPYSERLKGIDDLTIFYPGEYLDSDPWYALEKTLEKGWDIVLLDSFSDLKDKLADVIHETGKKLELKLINLMVKHCKGLELDTETDEKILYNDRGVNTTFICINHSTKGGEYEGSPKIKYNTSGMLEVRMDKEGQTYVTFSKNRVGRVGLKLYFDLTSDGQLVYNESRLDSQIEASSRRAKSIEFEKETSEKFDMLISQFTKNDISEKNILLDDIVEDESEDDQ